MEGSRPEHRAQLVQTGTEELEKIQCREDGESERLRLQLKCIE